MEGPIETELADRAPARHRTRLRMLGLMPRQGRCAEIGVWDGKFSEVILAETDLAQLVLIDPWDMLSETAGDSIVHGRWEDGGFMRELYLRVAERDAHLPKVILGKGYSVPVLETFPDGYFDWVYIDGNHGYDHVLADLRVAARKLRRGGLIAGDDFFWTRDGRQEVREAVLDFLAGAGAPRKVPPLPKDAEPLDPVETPARMGQQYLIPVTEAMKRAAAPRPGG